jgi:hypothetical protein
MTNATMNKLPLLLITILMLGCSHNRQTSDLEQVFSNPPYLFKKYLAKAKALTLTKPENERIMTINVWNEWGEGSYLEPDMIN